MNVPKYLLMSMSIALFLFFATADAAITPGQIPGASDLNIQPSPVKDFPQAVSVLAQVVHWVYIVFFIVAVLFILFAAYDYLTARGEPETVKKAHRQIFWAAVAIVVALMAVGVEVIVKDFLTNYNSANTQGNPTTIPQGSFSPSANTFPTVPQVQFTPSATKR